jgi:YHS domain-containing protein
LFKEYAASGELELKNTLRVTENSELVYLGENGKSISGWKSTEGATFYFDPNNSNYAATSKFVTIDGATYYFGSNSVKQTGAQFIDGKGYYFDASGMMLKNQKVDAMFGFYLLQEDGTMFIGEKTIDGVKYYFDSQDGVGRVWQEARILAYVRQLFNTCGKNLRACYDWFVKTIVYKTLPIPYPTPAGYTEVQTYALYGFDNHYGNCFCYAAGFYYVAKYLGYDAYFVQARVVGRDGNLWDHGWVETNENGVRYIYDPEMQRERKVEAYRQLKSNPVIGYVFN